MNQLSKKRGKRSARIMAIFMIYLFLGSFLPIASFASESGQEEQRAQELIRTGDPAAIRGETNSAVIQIVLDSKPEYARHLSNTQLQGLGYADTERLASIYAANRGTGIVQRMDGHQTRVLMTVAPEAAPEIAEDYLAEIDWRSSDMSDARRHLVGGQIAGILIQHTEAGEMNLVEFDLEQTNVALRQVLGAPDNFMFTMPEGDVRLQGEGDDRQLRVISPDCSGPSVTNQGCSITLADIGTLAAEGVAGPVNIIAHSGTGSVGFTVCRGSVIDLSMCQHVGGNIASVGFNAAGDMTIVTRIAGREYEFTLKKGSGGELLGENDGSYSFTSWSGSYRLTFTPMDEDIQLDGGPDGLLLEKPMSFALERIDGNQYEGVEGFLYREDSRLSFEMEDGFVRSVESVGSRVMLDKQIDMPDGSTRVVRTVMDGDFATALDSEGRVTRFTNKGSGGIYFGLQNELSLRDVSNARTSVANLEVGHTSVFNHGNSLQGGGMNAFINVYYNTLLSQELKKLEELFAQGEVGTIRIRVPSPSEIDPTATEEITVSCNSLDDCQRVIRENYVEAVSERYGGNLNQIFDNLQDVINSNNAVFMQLDFASEREGFMRSTVFVHEANIYDKDLGDFDSSSGGVSVFSYKPEGHRFYSYAPDNFSGNLLHANWNYGEGKSQRFLVEANNGIVGIRANMADIDSSSNINQNEAFNKFHAVSFITEDTLGSTVFDSTSSTIMRFTAYTIQERIKEILLEQGVPQANIEEAVQRYMQENLAEVTLDFEQIGGRLYREVQRNLAGYSTVLDLIAQDAGLYEISSDSRRLIESIDLKKAVIEALRSSDTYQLDGTLQEELQVSELNIGGTVDTVIERLKVQDPTLENWFNYGYYSHAGGVVNLNNAENEVLQILSSSNSQGIKAQAAMSLLALAPQRRQDSFSGTYDEEVSYTQALYDKIKTIWPEVESSPQWASILLTIARTRINELDSAKSTGQPILESEYDLAQREIESLRSNFQNQIPIENALLELFISKSEYYSSLTLSAETDSQRASYEQIQQEALNAARSNFEKLLQRSDLSESDYNLIVKYVQATNTVDGVVSLEGTRSTVNSLVREYFGITSEITEYQEGEDAKITAARRMLVALYQENAQQSLSEGNHDVSLQIWEELLSITGLDRSSSSILEGYANSLSANKKFSEAEEYFDMAIERRIQETDFDTNNGLNLYTQISGIQNLVMSSLTNYESLGKDSSVVIERANTYLAASLDRSKTSFADNQVLLMQANSYRTRNSDGDLDVSNNNLNIIKTNVDSYLSTIDLEQLDETVKSNLFNQYTNAVMGIAQNSQILNTRKSLQEGLLEINTLREKGYVSEEMRLGLANFEIDYRKQAAQRLGGSEGQKNIEELFRLMTGREDITFDQISQSLVNAYDKKEEDLGLSSFLLHSDIESLMLAAAVVSKSGGVAARNSYELLMQAQQDLQDSLQEGHFIDNSVDEMRIVDREGNDVTEKYKDRITALQSANEAYYRNLNVAKANLVGWTHESLRDFNKQISQRNAALAQEAFLSDDFAELEEKIGEIRRRLSTAQNPDEIQELEELLSTLYSQREDFISNAVSHARYGDGSGRVNVGEFQGNYNYYMAEHLAQGNDNQRLMDFITANNLGSDDMILRMLYSEAAIGNNQQLVNWLSNIRTLDALRTSQQLIDNQLQTEYQRYKKANEGSQDLLSYEEWASQNRNRVENLIQSSVDNIARSVQGIAQRIEARQVIELAATRISAAEYERTGQAQNAMNEYIRERDPANALRLYHEAHDAEISSIRSKLEELRIRKANLERQEELSTYDDIADYSAGTTAYFASQIKDIDDEIAQLTQGLNVIYSKKNMILSLFDNPAAYSFNNPSAIVTPLTEGDRRRAAEDLSLANSLIAQDSNTGFSANLREDRAVTRTELRMLLESTQSRETAMLIAEYLVETQRAEGNLGMAIQDLDFIQRKAIISGVDFSPALQSYVQDRNFQIEGRTEIAIKSGDNGALYARSRIQDQSIMTEVLENWVQDRREQVVRIQEATREFEVERARAETDPQAMYVEQVDWDNEHKDVFNKFFHVVWGGVSSAASALVSETQEAASGMFGGQPLGESNDQERDRRTREAQEKLERRTSLIQRLGEVSSDEAIVLLTRGEGVSVVQGFSRDEIAELQKMNRETDGRLLFDLRMLTADSDSDISRARLEMTAMVQSNNIERIRSADQATRGMSINPATGEYEYMGDQTVLSIAISAPFQAVNHVMNGLTALTDDDTVDSYVRNRVQIRNALTTLQGVLAGDSEMTMSQLVSMSDSELESIVGHENFENVRYAMENDQFLLSSRAQAARDSGDYERAAELDIELKLATARLSIEQRDFGGALDIISSLESVPESLRTQVELVRREANYENSMNNFRQGVQNFGNMAVGGGIMRGLGAVIGKAGGAMGVSRFVPQRVQLWTQSRQLARITPEAQKLVSRTTSPTLMQRINPFSRGMPQNYVDDIASSYDDFLRASASGNHQAAFSAYGKMQQTANTVALRQSLLGETLAGRVAFSVKGFGMNSLQIWRPAEIIEEVRDEYVNGVGLGLGIEERHGGAGDTAQSARGVITSFFMGRKPQRAIMSTPEYQSQATSRTQSYVNENAAEFRNSRAIVDGNEYTVETLDEGSIVLTPVIQDQDEITLTPLEVATGRATFLSPAGIRVPLNDRLAEIKINTMHDVYEERMSEDERQFNSYQRNIQLAQTSEQNALLNFQSVESNQDVSSEERAEYYRGYLDAREARVVAEREYQTGFLRASNEREEEILTEIVEKTERLDQGRIVDILSKKKNSQELVQIEMQRAQTLAEMHDATTALYEKDIELLKIKQGRTLFELGLISKKVEEGTATVEDISKLNELREQNEEIQLQIEEFESVVLDSKSQSLKQKIALEDLFLEYVSKADLDSDLKQSQIDKSLEAKMDLEVEKSEFDFEFSSTKSLNRLSEDAQVNLLPLFTERDNLELEQEKDIAQLDLLEEKMALLDPKDLKLQEIQDEYSRLQMKILRRSDEILVAKQKIGEAAILLSNIGDSQARLNELNDDSSSSVEKKTKIQNEIHEMSQRFSMISGQSLSHFDVFKDTSDLSEVERNDGVDLGAESKEDILSPDKISQDQEIVLNTQDIERELLGEGLDQLPSLKDNHLVSDKLESFFRQRGYQYFYQFALTVSVADLERTGLSLEQAKVVMKEVVAKQIADVTGFELNDIPMLVASYAIDQGVVNYQDLVINLDRKVVEKIDGIDSVYAEGITYQLVRDYFEETFLLNNVYDNHENVGSIDNSFSEIIIDNYGSINTFIVEVRDTESIVESVAKRLNVEVNDVELIIDWARDRLGQISTQKIKTNKNLVSDSGFLSTLEKELGLAGPTSDVIKNYENALQSRYSGRISPESRALIDSAQEPILLTEDMIVDDVKTLTLSDGRTVEYSKQANNLYSIIRTVSAEGENSELRVTQSVRDNIEDMLEKDCDGCSGVIIDFESCKNCVVESETEVQGEDVAVDGNLALDVQPDAAEDIFSDEIVKGASVLARSFNPDSYELDSYGIRMSTGIEDILDSGAVEFSDVVSKTRDLRRQFSEGIFEEIQKEYEEVFDERERLLRAITVIEGINDESPKQDFMKNEFEALNVVGFEILDYEYGEEIKTEALKVASEKLRPIESRFKVLKEEISEQEKFLDYLKDGSWGNEGIKTMVYTGIDLGAPYGTLYDMFKERYDRDSSVYKPFRDWRGADSNGVEILATEEFFGDIDDFTSVKDYTQYSEEELYSQESFVEYIEIDGERIPLMGIIMGRVPVGDNQHAWNLYSAHSSRYRIDKIMQEAERTWNDVITLIDMDGDRVEIAKKIARFEKLWYAANPYGRAGAATGDMNSYFLMRLAGLELETYSEKDLHALGMPMDEYVDWRLRIIQENNPEIVVKENVDDAVDTVGNINENTEEVVVDPNTDIETEVVSSFETETKKSVFDWLKGVFVSESKPTVQAKDTLSADGKARRKLVKNLFVGAAVVASGPAGYQITSKLAERYLDTPVSVEPEVQNEIRREVVQPPVNTKPEVVMEDGIPYLKAGKYKAKINIIKDMKIPRPNYQAGNFRDAEDIKNIILHTTTTKTKNPVLNTFQNRANKVSSQFIVDTNGEIIVSTYEGVDIKGKSDVEIIDICEKVIAHHIGSKTTTDPDFENANSIGIEVVGNDAIHMVNNPEVLDNPRSMDIYDSEQRKQREDFKPDNSQKESYIALTKYLMTKYDIPRENVRSHMEITRKGTQLRYNKQDGTQVKADVFARLDAEQDQRISEGTLIAANSRFSEQFMDAVLSSSAASKVGAEAKDILSDISGKVVEILSESDVMEILEDDSFEGIVAIDNVNFEIRKSDNIDDLGVNEVTVGEDGKPLVVVTINPDIIADSDYTAFITKVHEIAEGLLKVKNFGYPIEFTNEIAFIHNLAIMVEQEIDSPSLESLTTEDLRAASYISPLALIKNKQRMYEDLGDIVDKATPSYRSEEEVGPKATVYHKGGKSYKLLFDYGNGEYQIAAFDIHNFKHQVNTRYGHLGGDAYLQQAGRSLDEILSEWNGEDATTFIGDRIISDDFKSDLIDKVGPLEVKDENDPARGTKYKLDVSNLDFYIGVSQKSSVADIQDFQRMMFDSSYAGKTAQLRDIGQLDPAKLIVMSRDLAQAEVDAAKVKTGSKVLEYDESLKQTFCCDNMDTEGLGRRSNALGLIENEYEFFGEKVLVRNIDNLLASRDEAVASNNREYQQEVEDKILKVLLTNGEFGNFLDGNDNFKLIANRLLESQGQIDYQDVFIVGGDEIGFLISGNGKVRFARIDINNFGKTNQRYNVQFADTLKYEILKIIRSNIRADNIHEVSDADLAKNINLELLNHLADIEAGKLHQKYNLPAAREVHFQEKYRPSLSIGIANIDGQFERFDATLLNAISDDAAESIKKISKAKLVADNEEDAKTTRQVVEEGGFFKEANLAYLISENEFNPSALDRIKMDWVFRTEDFIDFDAKFLKDELTRNGEELGQC